MDDDNKLILVTGSEGLIGSRFLELYPQKNKVHAPKHIDFDINKPSEIEAIFKSFDFKAVVHFAAKTNITEAESERGNKQGDFWQTNVEATKYLAQAASKYTNIQFIYVSTDRVFPGTLDNPGPYSENHLVENEFSKLSWYGYTKAQGELHVKQIFGDKAVIVRLATLAIRENAKQSGFFENIIKKYDENQREFVNDSKLTLSDSDDACKVIDLIINKKLAGTYHVSTTNTASPYEIAEYLLQKVKGIDIKLKKVTLAEYLKKLGGEPSVLYPQFSGLDVKHTQKILNFNFGTWKEAVDIVIANRIKK